mmetsp:Transcript_2747/g.4285  ORF Transcript_2747/g.4285 Transcript_2747/m.4285 type:complete len:88 (+) Transcript_2747:230-493(+)
MHPHEDVSNQLPNLSKTGRCTTYQLVLPDDSSLSDYVQTSGLVTPAYDKTPGASLSALPTPPKPVDHHPVLPLNAFAHKLIKEYHRQ